MVKFLLSLFFIFIPELGFASNTTHSCKKTVLSLSNHTPMKSKSKTDGLISNHTPTEINSHLQLTQTNLQETPSPISSQLLVNSKPQTSTLQKNSSSPSKSPQSKSKLIPFLEAQKLIQLMNISDSREYLKLRKKDLLPDGFPSNPNRAYKDEGWTTWKDFLRSSYVAKNKKNFMKFEDAIKTVREKQIKSINQYHESLLTGLLENLPWNPNRTYKNKGWVNWKSFFGTELHSFEEAQKIAQSMKIESKDHYLLLRKKGLLPNMPANPEQVYKDKGWTTWGDFTGSGNVSNNSKEFFSFEEAQKIVQSMKIESREEYLKLRADGLLPDGMPSNPNKIYENKGWTTWGDFTGSGNVSKKNKKLLSFKDARKIVQSMKIKSKEEYLQLRADGLLPDGFPETPNRDYKDEGWTTWKDFLGSSYVAKNKKNFMKFEDAQKLVQSMKIESRDHYRLLRKKGLLPSMPARPEHVYKDKGWVNWKSFFGTELHSFEDAQKLVQSMKIESRDHYHLLRKKGLLPSMPATPEHVYKDKGWVNWWHFFGKVEKEFLSFEEAQKIAQSMKIESMDHYHLLRKKGLLPNMPARPDKIYKNKGWTTWGDFHGRGNVSKSDKKILPFAEAQKFVQSIGVESQQHYRLLRKEGLIPNDMPASPDKEYKGTGWTTWGDFTGSGNVSHKNKEFFSFEDAQKLVQSMKIESMDHYHLLRKKGLLPNMPARPDKIYKNKGWVNWRHFFGKVEKEFLSFEEAQKLVQSMNILSSTQYNSFKKNGLFPEDNMNATPSKFYKDKGWKGWKDFLGTTKMMKYNQAKKYAIHEAKVNTVEEFIEWLNSDQVPLKFPQNPAEFYEEWTNAKDFLDLNNETEIITHLEFKKFVQKLNLKTKRDYTQWWIAFGKNLDFMPRHPETFYEKEWEGWDNYLIPPQKNLTQESQQIH